MNYPILPRLQQTAFVSALGLSGLALVSLLGTSPSQAAAEPSNLANPSAAESVLVANLFRQIGDAIRNVGEIVETVNTLDSFLQQMGAGENTSPQPPASPPNAPVNTGSAPAASPVPQSTATQVPSNMQTIHRDNNPTKCHTHTQLQCQAFQIAELPSEGTIFFNYYFDGEPFSFVATTASEFQLDNSASYRVVSIVYNDETAEMPGICTVFTLGGSITALCQAENGLEFTYYNPSSNQ